MNRELTCPECDYSEQAVEGPRAYLMNANCPKCGALMKIVDHYTKEEWDFIQKVTEERGPLPASPLSLEEHEDQA